MMHPEMIEHGLRLEQQVAGVIQLLAAAQGDLDQLGDFPAAARAATALAQRRGELEATIEKLREGQGELERRLGQRTAELAGREVALETTRSQLRVLTRRLVQVQEDERRALARDLHDTSGQAMTVINLGLAMLKREGACSERMDARIEDLRRVATTVAEDLHRLSVNLRPSSLDRYGLVPALEDLVASFRKQTGIEVDFAAEGLDDRLPAEMETELYRIVQEASTNIARYSDASHASISLRRREDTVEVRVEDDGQGFDVAEALGRGRLGLLGMRERAEMLGGVLNIESRTDRGTTIYAEVPVSEPGLLRAPEPAASPAAPRAGPPQAPADSGAPSAAGEPARAKALSDALVDITAGMARASSSDELLAFVLATSAEAIDCDHGYVLLREDDDWRISHGYQLPDGMTGGRVSDQDVPAAVEVERTGQMVVVNDLQADGVPNGMARRWGARSAVSLPLVSAGQFLGVATYLHGAETVPIRPSEVEFLIRLASLVSLALENSRLQKRADEERLRAAGSLARSEAIYRSIARSFPNGAIYVFDHDLRFQVVEGEGLSGFGQTREGMEGRTIWETMDPDTVEIVEPRYRRTLAGESMHFETRHGPQIENRIVSADYRPIRGADGQVLAGLLVARDISEGVRMVNLLQETRAEVERERDVLSSILSALPSGLIVYDREGRITQINNLARDLLAYDAETWKRPVGERVARAVELFAPGGFPLARAEYPAIRALAGEVVRNANLFLHLPAHPEKDFWAMISACPVHGLDGEPQGAVLTLTDVTALHQARTGLQEANQALQQQADQLREAKERLEQRVQERTIELAVMLDQQEVNRSQLEALSRRLVEMQEHERSYVADQLYNQAAQVLAAVRMQLWAWEKRQGDAAPEEQLAAMKRALDQTILALHDLAAQLRPAGLARATLTAVLRDYVSRFAASQGMAVWFDGGGTEDLRVPSEVVTAVYRTIQEAMANVTQHAQAREVTLSLGRVGDSLIVSLADNGVGFDPAGLPANGGVGLIGMRERIRSIGGSLDISSSPGGTRILIEVPVGPQPAR